MQEKIMVIEDDEEMNQGICYMLKKEGFLAIPANTVMQAKELCKAKSPDLILLDINLPDGDGFAFIQWEKRTSDIPVIFLTARDLEEDALKGYELGAEDYIVKPFSLRVLMKKIRLILQRNQKTREQIFEDSFLKIDFRKGKVEVLGKECMITPTEFCILQQLVMQKGQLLTYDVLLDKLWENGNQFVDKHALAVNINRLRKKLEAGEQKYIENIYGMGYRWIR